MPSYRTILIVVTLLSFLSIAGMREIRASLGAALLLINIFAWSWPRIDKWRKQRNRHAAGGEQQLHVGNYGEAEKSLLLAAVEAQRWPAGKRAAILRNLALAQRKQRKFAEAEQNIRQAMALISDTAGQARSQYAECLDVLADIYRDQANYPQAQKILMESLSVEEALPQPNSGLLAKRRHNLAMAFHHAGDHAAASPHFARALELQEQAFGPEHSETGRMLSETGAVLHKAGDHAEALRRLERALRIQEKTVGADAPEFTEGLYHLALAYEDSGDLDQAVAQYERILQLRNRQVSGNELELAEVCFYLARVYLKLNRLARAEEMAQTAVLILEKQPTAELASLLELQAQIYERTGRRAEAAAVREKVRAIYSVLGEPSRDPMDSRHASA